MKRKKVIKVWEALLNMKRGHAGEENFCAMWINVVFHPFRPCVEDSSICYWPRDFIVLRGSFIKRPSSFAYTSPHKHKTYTYKIHTLWFFAPKIRYNIYERIKNRTRVSIYMWCLQDFHSGSIHPPYVGVEDQIVHILPIHSMLLNWFRHDNTVQYAVHLWIIWVWLHKERCPVELHRSIVILQTHNHRLTN